MSNVSAGKGLVMVSAVLLAGFYFSPAIASDTLVPLTDSDMSGVTGREGIALDLELRVNADSDGVALPSMGNCTGIGNGCILALQFANRIAGGGEWLVLKDFYGVFRLNNLQMNASRLPASPSAFADASRFRDQAGACLIPGCDPSGSLAAALDFPSTPGFNSDIDWALNIGRASVQFGANAFLGSADTGASFVGIRVADTVTDTARIDVGGRIQLYGF